MRWNAHFLMEIPRGSCIEMFSSHRVTCIFVHFLQFSSGVFLFCFVLILFLLEFLLELKAPWSVTQLSFQEGNRLPSFPKSWSVFQSFQVIRISCCWEKFNKVLGHPSMFQIFVVDIIWKKGKQVQLFSVFACSPRAEFLALTYHDLYFLIHLSMLLPGTILSAQSL